MAMDFTLSHFQIPCRLVLCKTFWVADFNADGLMEIFSAGNLFASSMQEGRYAADRGSIITGLSDNHLVISNYDTGISLRGDIRRIASLNFQGNELVMVVRNNDSIQWFKRR